MPDERSAASIKQFSRAHGFVAKQLFVMDTEPVGDLEAVYANLEEHLRYWVTLENEGKLFAAGPKLPLDERQDWSGAGLVIIRAESFEDAQKIAREDPMHLSGARRFELYPWLMNHFRA